MKKFLFAIMLATCSITVATAGNNTDSVHAAGFNKLSETEKADIIKMVAEKATQNDSRQDSKSALVVEDKVERWVKIGSNIGQGLAGAAKEVGVAVNDFAQTPVGQMTMALIVWHMIGAQLIHLFGGVLIWIVGFGFLHYLIKRSYPDEIIFDPEKKNVFGNFAVKQISKGKVKDEGVWIFCFAVVGLAGLIAIFTY